MAVDRLPERQREVALLVWGEALAADEIAQVLRFPKQAFTRIFIWAKANCRGDWRR